MLIYSCIHTYIYILIHTYVHTYTCSYIHILIHTYAYTYIHSCIHTYAERIKNEIDSKKQMFPSELSKHLTRILNRQWHPILKDMRRGLTSIGTKFLGLGMVEIIGRPLIILYPLGLGIMEIVEIVRLLDTNKTISIKNYMELFKCICYLFGTWQLLSITASFASMGWMCLLIGISFLILTIDENLMKYATPFLVPHLVMLDKLSYSVGKLQEKLVVSLEKIGNGNNGSNSNSNGNDNGNDNGNGNGIGNGPDIGGDNGSRTNDGLRRRYTGNLSAAYGM